MIRVQVVNRFTLNGTIDAHDPVGVTFRITGGDKPFRLTVITVNWGRGYKPGEFHRNVMRVLNRVDELEYVMLLIQELDETDTAPEYRIFKAEMEPGTTIIGKTTREPIAVSPGVRITRQRRRMTMDQGDRIGAPNGTGPRRYLVSCVAHIHGVSIGLGNQHPHRNLPNGKVQAARRRGQSVTEEVIGELADSCDLVIHGGDFNDANYPKSHPREKTANEEGYDSVRYVIA